MKRAGFDPAPTFMAKLEACKRELNKDEPRRREEFADVCAANEKQRTVRIFVDGSVIQVERSPLWEPYEEERPHKRGEIHGFTRKSRKRFLLFVASLSHSELPLFVTLTYPAWWPETWNSWKSHLQTLWKRIRYEWPRASAVWKLEPQKRGAPHFHLIVWGIQFIPKEWLAQAWFEVVDSKDQNHLAAGTSVERARSFRGVMCYAGKKYLGKEVDLPPGWDAVGRFWGALGRKHLPRSRVMEFSFTKQAAHRFRRLVRRFFASKGKTWKSKNGVTLYTQGHMQWARAVDWAETGSCQPLDFALPLTSQPF